MEWQKKINKTNFVDNFVVVVVVFVVQRIEVAKDQSMFESTDKRMDSGRTDGHVDMFQTLCCIGKSQLCRLL